MRDAAAEVRVTTRTAVSNKLTIIMKYLWNVEDALVEIRLLRLILIVGLINCLLCP